MLENHVDKQITFNTRYDYMNQNVGNYGYGNVNPNYGYPQVNQQPGTLSNLATIFNQCVERIIAH